MSVIKNMNEFIQMNPNFNFDNFKQVKKHSNDRIETPLATFSNYQIFINAKLIKDLKIKYDSSDRFVEFFTDFDSQQLMLMISSKRRSENSYKLTTTRNRATVSCRDVINQISKNCSHININNFNYKFKPILIDNEHGRIIIDLNQVFARKRRGSVK